MPRLLSRYPKYRKHSSGQARVTIDGTDIYLGPYGSKASRAEYDRVIAEWLANGRRLPVQSGDITITELIQRYWEHCKTYYRRPDGSQTSEVAVIRTALKPMKRLYGHTPANTFDGVKLIAVGHEMIRLGWTRKSINKHFHRIRAMFRWGTVHAGVSADVFKNLEAVDPFSAGRCDAKESAPVTIVAEERVNAVLPLLSPQIQAMIRLQLITGMRPGEVCQMRRCDIKLNGPKVGEQQLWEYKPPTHKTQYMGHERIIYLGTQAQEILSEWLRPELNAYLFAPSDAEAERLRKRHEARETPEGQGNEPGTNRVRSPKRKAGEKYDVASYRRAVARACEAAFGMPAEIQRAKKDTPEQAKDKAQKRRAWRDQNVWHPHQLRHNAGTRMREEYGVECASVLLGHRSISVTELYAEKNLKKAQQIAALAG